MLKPAYLNSTAYPRLLPLKLGSTEQTSANHAQPNTKPKNHIVALMWKAGKTNLAKIGKISGTVFASPPLNKSLELRKILLTHKQPAYVVENDLKSWTGRADQSITRLGIKLDFQIWTGGRNVSESTNSNPGTATTHIETLNMVATSKAWTLECRQ